MANCAADTYDQVMDNTLAAHAAVEDWQTIGTKQDMSHTQPEQGHIYMEPRIFYVIFLFCYEKK